MSKLKPSLQVRLADENAERLRRHTDARIAELQSLPFAEARLFPNVEIGNNATVTVRHGLGRAPRWIGPSVLRGPEGAALAAGLLVEYPILVPGVGPVDRSQFIVLAAFGFGAPITIDLVVL